MTFKDIFLLLIDLFQGGWQSVQKRWQHIQARRPVTLNFAEPDSPYRILSSRVTRKDSHLPYLIVFPIASCLCLWLCFFPLMINRLQQVPDTHCKPHKVTEQHTCKSYSQKAYKQIPYILKEENVRKYKVETAP